MSALVAVALRELRLRSPVLLLALGLGCVPAVLGRYGPWILSSASIGVPGAAMIVGLSMLVVTSLASGWSTIAAEASSGRLGFLFSRPVPWWGIWGGKLTAAVGLPVAAALLATLPSVVTDLAQWRALLSSYRSGAALLGLGLLPVLIVGCANAASVAFRGQPARRAFDMVLSAVFLYVLFAPSRLLTVGAWSLGGETPFAVLQAPILLALVAGSAMQVHAGRMDQQRSHALLSLTVWSLAFASLAGLLAIGSLMWGAVPSDLRRVTWVEAAGRGPWIFVAGPVRWGLYSAAFLYDADSGRHLSLGSARHVSRVSFSPDGSLAAIRQGNMFDPAFQRTRVVWLEAKKPGVEKVFDFLPEEVSITPRGEYLIAFSKPGPGGSWMRLAFYKLPSGQLINSLTTSAVGLAHEPASWLSGFRSPVVFQDDGRLRVYVHEQDRDWRRATFHIVAADLPAFLAAGKGGAHVLSPTGRFVAGRGDVQLRTSAAGDRVLVQARQPLSGRGRVRAAPRDGWKICVHDGVSGEHLETLFEGVEAAEADFLSDGRIVVAVNTEGNHSIHLVGPEHHDPENPSGVQSVHLGPAETVVLAGEVSMVDARWLLLGVRRRATDFRLTTAGLELIEFPEDARRPEIHKRARRYLHLHSRYWWPETGVHRGLYPAMLKVGPGATLSSARRPTPGSPGSRLLISERGTLVRFDTDPRKLTALLGRR